MPESPERTALYRLYDVTDQLLYVGISSDPRHRWKSHALFNAETWWPRVSHKEVEWFDSRLAAAEAEVTAIKTEIPKHNTRHGRSPLTLTPLRSQEVAENGTEDAPEQVANLIRAAIHADILAPGDRLPGIQELCDQTEVSIDAARKAMKILKGEGVVVTRHGAGHWVSMDPSPPSPADPPSTEAVPIDALETARQLLARHPFTEVLSSIGASQLNASLDGLHADVAKLLSFAREEQFADVSATVTNLLPTLERAVRSVEPSQRPEVYVLLAHTYQALADAFSRRGELGAAWVSADRSLQAAESSGLTLNLCAIIVNLAPALVRMGQAGRAENATRKAIDALNLQEDQSPDVLLVLGSLHLAMASICGRNGERAEARAAIQEARALASQVGDTQGTFSQRFGPTTVEIQAATTAIDLGDAGEALDIGLCVDADSLPPAQQAVLFAALGRAHAQLSRTPEALGFLLRAEALIPGVVRTDSATRQAIRELVLIAGPNAPRELMALAERADAME